jgi:hypothetical protein
VEMNRRTIIADNPGKDNSEVDGCVIFSSLLQIRHVHIYVVLSGEPDPW